jgi:hypothetical protein
MFKSFNKGKKKSLGQHLSGKGFNVSVPSATATATSSSSSTSTTTGSNNNNNNATSAADGGAQWCSPEELQERVPALLSKFVSLLGSVEDGLDTRGLFRVVPEKVRDQLKTLRNALNASVESGAGVDSVDIGKLCSSVHAAAHAFKRYLQSLPEPLFSYALYDSFILTHSIVDQEEKLNELRRLLKQLPVGYKETAKTLLHFFALVTRASAKNGVTFERFSNMFGATFLRAEDHVYYMQNDAVAVAAILKLMVDNNQSLFRMTVGLAAQRRRTIRRPASLALVGAGAAAPGAVGVPPVALAGIAAAGAAQAAVADGSVGVSRVIMRANTVDTLAPIAPAGSNAARSFYPPSMSDEEAQRAMKAEQRRTASSLVKFSPSSSNANSLESSPARTDKAWQTAVVSSSPVNTPPTATVTSTVAAPPAPVTAAPAAGDASADGSSGDDTRSSGRVRRGSDAVQQRRRHRTGTRNSNTSDGTPSADASEEGSPRVRSTRSAHRSDSHRRTNSTADEAASAAAATVPTADDPLGVATASTSSAGAHGDSVSVTVVHAGKPLSITFLQRDTLESVLDALSKAAGTTIADVKVVSSADGAQVGLLSQSTEAPFATHFGMLDEGLQFSYETIARKKLRKKRTLTNNMGGGEDEVQARIASLLRGIKSSIEQAALFSDAIALSTAVRDTLKLVNNAVKQTGADIDALREFKNTHPRAPLERAAPTTADEQLALELNNLLDIVLPLMDQLLDLCAFLAAAPEGSGVDADDVLSKVDEILAGASV